VKTHATIVYSYIIASDFIVIKSHEWTL